MQVVILCGGRGTRLREYSKDVPKPLVQIGGRPILWHIMQMYASAGFTDFTLCLGYKGELIRDFFLQRSGPQTADGVPTVRTEEGWTVRLADTGLDTMTGGRLHRIRPLLAEQSFFACYGDCVCDLDVPALLAFHRSAGRTGTATVVRPPARFGVLELAGDQVTAFVEKPVEQRWINAGFFVFEPALFELLHGDEDVLERQPLAALAGAGQLSGFRHEGYWQCMDTPTEVLQLNEAWQRGVHPWLREPTPPRFATMGRE